VLTKVKVKVNVKVKHVVGPVKGLKGESQLDDHFGRRQKWALPEVGVARLGRCQVGALPSWGVAKLGRRQVKASMMSPPDTHG